MMQNWDGEQTSPTLTASNANGAQRMPDKENFNSVVDDVEYIVRRLIPDECGSLQGFPQNWCNGLGGSDTAIYRAYGNSVAIPCVCYVLEGIADILKEFDWM